MATPATSALAARARHWTTLLTSWISVTGTAGEVEFPNFLLAALRDSSHFRAHLSDVELWPVAGDPPGRACLAAIVRGAGRATVVLTGHFDTVPVDDYADLAPLAGEPDALRQALIARLKATGGHPLALADLESGEFLPGRGLLDMKAGLAAGLAVLEAFAADPDRVGNLIFLAVPDEENQSAGMRAAAPELIRFAKRNSLDLKLAINLDAICDNGDGRAGQVIAKGTIGKLLVSALAVGKEAHACYPLDGVNAAYLAAELVTEMEMTPELAEFTGHEIAVPPTVLSVRDLKPSYNVTTPGRAWVFWNVITQTRGADEVLQTAETLATRAMAFALKRISARNARLEYPMDQSSAWSNIRVKRFAEVFEAACQADASFEQRFRALAAELCCRADLDFPTRSQVLAEFAFAASAIPAPVIILLIGSMPYPARRLTDPAIEQLLGEVARSVSRDFATAVTPTAFFPAISDMSFLGPADHADVAVLAKNTPLWGSSVVWEAIDPAADFAVINIGPWGRDYHHWLERAHERYTFEVLPELVRRAAAAVLASSVQASPLGA